MKLAVTAFLWLLILPAILLLAGGAMMIAWNLSMPALLGLPQASFANGLGLACLAMLLRNQPAVERK